MFDHTCVLILAGGAGTRFWPASREHKPKQFLDITGSGKSLLRATADRFLPFIPAERIYVMTHQDYADQVASALPELTTAQILTEPSRNNTAPAIALGTLKLWMKDPQGNCIVAAADHLITDTAEFENVLRRAVEHTTTYQSLITLNIQPSRPDTGYGYIEFDPEDRNPVKKVLSFREKPDEITAIEYINRKSFGWNAGIFIWTFEAILAAFQYYAQDIFAILEPGVKVFDTPAERDFLASRYPKTEKISVDYAILERSDNVYTIPCEIGWSDLGTWNSLYDVVTSKMQDNAVLAPKVCLEDSQRNLVLAPGEKLVVIKGLEDYIIVDTKDCLLIYPRTDEQNIKALKEKLRGLGYEKYL